MQKLSYSRKLSLLGLISLTAIGVVVYSFLVDLQKDIRILYLEMDGLTLIEPIGRCVQLMQQHRGLSAGLLAGVQTMQEGRAGKAQEVDAAINAAEEKLPARLKASTDWQTIRTDWKQLHQYGLGWPVAENFTAQTKLIRQIQLFKVTIADDYALTLDPEIDTYYLIDTAVNELPHALEHIGVVAAPDAPAAETVPLRRRRTGSGTSGTASTQQGAPAGAVAIYHPERRQLCVLSDHRIGRWRSQLRSPAWLSVYGTTWRSPSIGGPFSSSSMVMPKLLAFMLEITNGFSSTPGSQSITNWPDL